MADRKAVAKVLHTCDARDRGRAAMHRPQRVHSERGKGSLTVDMHCHVLATEVEAVVSDLPPRQVERDIAATTVGQASLDYNAEMMSDLLPRLTDVTVRLRDMDAMGIDVQALSPSPTQYYYWADRETSRRIVEMQNDRIAEMCATQPDRFVGLAAVSLQFPEMAAEQVEHCVRRLGFRGVEVSSSVNGREIADPEFAPFWRKVEDLGVVVFLHPLGTTLGRRVNPYYLSNLVGVPLETTLALSHLIFGGVLDRHPGLKICAAHGGGFLGSYWGRSDRGWKVRPECSGSERPPSEYLKQIFYDSVVFDPEELRHILRNVGAGQVVLGTDYPFDMGNQDPLGLIGSVNELSDEDRTNIVGLNAAHLLGMRTRDSVAE